MLDRHFEEEISYQNPNYKEILSKPNNTKEKKRFVDVFATEKVLP